MGISDDFDPQKRGYDVSRQKGAYDETSARNHCLNRRDAEQFRDRERDQGPQSRSFSDGDRRANRDNDTKDHRHDGHGGGDYHQDRGRDKNRRRSRSRSRSGSRHTRHGRFDHSKESKSQPSGGYASLGTQHKPSNSHEQHLSQAARVAACDTKEDDPPPPEIAFIPRRSGSGEPPVFRQFFLLLCGLPCSGKTTFARALVAGKPWKFVRVSTTMRDRCGDDNSEGDPHCEEDSGILSPGAGRTQNECVSTIACIDECRRVLMDGKCPVLDMCNANPEQRKPFLDLARKSSNTPIECVVFSCGVEVCIRRCEGRNHRGRAGRANLCMEGRSKNRVDGRQSDGANEDKWLGKEREAVSSIARRFFPPLPTRINTEEFQTLRNVKDLYASNDAVLEYLNDPN